MKPAAATSTYTVSFATPKPLPRSAEGPVGRVPRVARQLARAHKIDEMIHVGELRDLATAARACGVTRARMTQVMNLLLLAPTIQEAILALPPMANGRDPISERSLRAVVAEPEWDRQRELWRDVCRT